MCTTKLGCFTQIQGIGNDPMYLRYSSFVDVLSRNVGAEYIDFFAEPLYSEIDDTITWYGRKWDEEPMIFSELDSEKGEIYGLLKDKYINYFKSAIEKASGEDKKILSDSLRFVSDDFLYCYDNKITLVAWGMQVDDKAYTPKGTITYTAAEPKVKVEFGAGDYGLIQGHHTYSIAIKRDTDITSAIIPQVDSIDGYRFLGWNENPEGIKAMEGLRFVAQYEKLPEPPQPIPEPEPEPEPSMCKCDFEVGKHGSIGGESQIIRECGYCLTDSDIPKVKPKRGYVFKGWDTNPLGYCLNSDTTFYAQYDKKPCFFKRFFLWLTGLKIWRWLRWVLLALLALLLSSLFFRTCIGCSGPVDNGTPHNILDGDGNIPSLETPIVAPIGDAPIIENPGAPSVVGDRLNIYFEDDNADLNKFAHEFKEAYPGSDYEIIGFDDEVKMVQIRIPATERDRVREEISGKITSQKFIVVDEAIFELSDDGPFSSTESNPGWHLKAINLIDAWKVAGTKGTPDIIVAVVDDGIDMGHKMFKDRITSPYNVFRQDNKLSKGVGHGTHVAGLAVGSDKKIDEGLSGVAPNCKLMPIQVFDNGRATFSSVTSGIMYAIHHDAKVINVSAGECFNGLSALPESSQLDLANNYFKNEEFVWNKIFAVAKKKNVTIVFAAGNDNILACVPPEHRNCEVITVAAVNHDLRAAQFTNYGPGANISAPGVDIYSSVPGNKYKFADGTSMAAPIVSGAVALLKSINPNLESEDIIRLLQSTGTPTDAEKVRPLIQLDKAVRALKSGEIPKDDVYSCRWFPDESAIVGNPSAEGSYLSLPDGTSLVTNPDGSVAIVDDETGASEVVIPAPGNGDGNGNGGAANGGNNNSGAGGTGSNGSSNGNNNPNQGASSGNNVNDGNNNSSHSIDGYEAIRRRIAQLKKQIEELEKQLPENKRK